MVWKKSKKLQAESKEILRSHIEKEIENIVMHNGSLILTKKSHDAFEKLIDRYDIELEFDCSNGNENSPSFMIAHIYLLDQVYQKIKARSEKKDMEIKITHTVSMRAS